MISDTCCLFALNNGDDVLEHIPLHEINAIEKIFGNNGTKQNSDRLVDIEQLKIEQRFTNAIQILTIPNGYNCGRAYYVQTDSPMQCTHLVEEISKLVTAARAR